MCTLYVSSQAVSVKLDSESLIIHDHRLKGAEAYRRMPLCKVERLIICGNPAVSMQALLEVMDKGIDCSFVTPNGRWRGRLASERSRNGIRRRRQYVCGQESQFNLLAARRMVADKIYNCAKSLGRLFANRGRSRDAEWLQMGAWLDEMRSRTDSVQSIEGLRGIEGECAAAYFRMLSRFFPAEFPFVARTRRPPKDPANALLSFAYGLLTSEFESAIQRHGLDPALGFMHADDLGRSSLALDLMEPFRPAIADLTVLNLLNHKVFKPEDFEPCAGDGVLLGEEGRKKFFRGYEGVMARKTDPGRSGAAVTVRGLIDRQVCAYAKLLEMGANAGEAGFFKMR